MMDNGLAELAAAGAVGLGAVLFRAGRRLRRWLSARAAAALAASLRYRP